MLEQLTEADHIKMVRRARQLRRDDGWQDLVQDTYLKALQVQANYSGRSSLATWLNGVMSNVHMNQCTVAYGRGARPGRKKLMDSYVEEWRRLNCPHGRRKGVVKQKDWQR